jgi:anti-sigma B factor antagonist
LTGISVEQPFDRTGFPAYVSGAKPEGLAAMVVVRMVKRRSPVSDRVAARFPAAAFTGHGEFDIREQWIGRVVVLSVCDAVDLLSAPRFTKAIGDALAKARDGVIVDLTEVDFLASIGMSILVEAGTHASAIPTRFGVVAEGAATSRPIKVLGLDAIVPLYATLDDALHDFRR